MRTLWCCLPIILLAAALPAAHAADGHPTPWAFEVSGIYNLADIEYSTVNEYVGELAGSWRTNPAFDVGTVEEFQDNAFEDFKIGFRYRRVHFGFTFCVVNQLHAKVEYRTFFNDGKFELKGNSREFLVYGGYMHPLFSWLDLGGFGSVGLGTTKLDITYRDPLSSGEPFEHRPEDNYPVWRAEARVRIHLTPYVALDLGGGYRSSVAEELRGDGTDSSGIPFFDKPAGFNFPLGKPITVDFTGLYYGAGLTLKSPFGP